MAKYDAVGREIERINRQARAKLRRDLARKTKAGARGDTSRGRVAVIGYEALMGELQAMLDGALREQANIRSSLASIETLIDQIRAFADLLAERERRRWKPSD